MRLSNHKHQGLWACLEALKSQKRALALGMDEVRQLLETLEAADDAELAQAMVPRSGSGDLGGPKERRFDPRHGASASAQRDSGSY